MKRRTVLVSFLALPLANMEMQLGNPIKSFDWFDRFTEQLSNSFEQFIDNDNNDELIERMEIAIETLYDETINDEDAPKDLQNIPVPEIEIERVPFPGKARQMFLRVIVNKKEKPRVVGTILTVRIRPDKPLVNVELYRH